jgi:hypothetical protein
LISFIAGRTYRPRSDQPTWPQVIPCRAWPDLTWAQVIHPAHLTWPDLSSGHIAARMTWPDLSSGHTTARITRPGMTDLATALVVLRHCTWGARSKQEQVWALSSCTSGSKNGVV